MKNKIPFEVRITALYVIVGALWIIFSDDLVLSFTQNPVQINVISIYKGWFYVAVTGILLFLLIKKEIVKRNHLYNELLVANKKAMESDRLKTAFLSNLSHYIRTPMNSILGFTDLIQSRNLDPEKRNRFLVLINEKSQHLLNTINNIIEISKIQENQVVIDKKKFSVSELQNKLIMVYGQEISNKGKNIKIYQTNNFQPEAQFMESDYGKIYHIYSNLICNAVNFTEKGEIEIGCQVKNNEYTFFIRDTGNGISEDRRKNLLLNYMQENPETYNTNEGSGLGLFVSANLLTFLGGRLWIDYSNENGSLFFFSIPVSPINQ